MLDEPSNPGITTLGEFYEHITKIPIEVCQAAWQNIKKSARLAGITLHLDCTKIYLLVLMVACRHRHAFVKVVGV